MPMQPVQDPSPDCYNTGQSDRNRENKIRKKDPPSPDKTGPRRAPRTAAILYAPEHTQACATHVPGQSCIDACQ